VPKADISRTPPNARFEPGSGAKPSVEIFKATQRPSSDIPPPEPLGHIRFALESGHQSAHQRCRIGRRCRSVRITPIQRDRDRRNSGLIPRTRS